MGYTLFFQNPKPGRSFIHLTKSDFLYLYIMPRLEIVVPSYLALTPNMIVFPDPLEGRF